jgi:hypothetical protein
METTVVEFVRALRGAGVPVSLSETLDSLCAITQVPLNRRDALKEALRATLIKSPRHDPVFEHLFPLFFDPLISMRGRQMKDPEDPEVVVREDLMELFAEGAIKASPLATALIAGDVISMERMAVEAAASAGLDRIRYPIQAGFFKRRLLERFDWQGIEDEIHGILTALEGLGWKRDQLEGLRRIFEGNAEAFKSILRRVVERQIAREIEGWQGKIGTEGIQGRSLSSLSEEEIQQMQDEVGRLAQLLRTKLSMRRKEFQRGRLDLRRTLRKNLQLGGVPMYLVRAKRKVKKAQVMALCDVSSSVWNAARFMLCLLYAIQDQFAKVRSFVFVSELGEVTEFFSMYDPNEALKKAMKEAGINYFSYTDYGEVFRRFHDEHIGDINRRTLVIIIGDGRNNYLPTQSWALEEVHRRANKVIWLNPEHRSMWRVGDSVIEEYAEYCDILRECRTIAQLRRFIWDLARMVPV